MTLSAQVLVGVKAGFHIPGAQDLKFKYFDRSLTLVETIHTNRVASNLSSFSGINVTVFGKKNFWSNNGIRLEAVTWEFDSRSRGFFVKEPPPINQAEQYRIAILTALIHKFGCPSFLEKLNRSKSYVYVGIGGGVVLTDIDPGRYQWHLGFQLLSGISVPVTNRFRGSIEVKYLITHDADNHYSSEPGWLVDTSGTSSWVRFGPHLDTRFITVQLGIQWAVWP